MDQPTTRAMLPSARNVPRSTRTFVIVFAVIELVLIVGALVYSKLR